MPLSHGVYAVHSASTDPLFTLGQSADAGTERIAEDGFTTEKTNMLNRMSAVKDHGEFVAPGGPDMGAALFVGESSEFFVRGVEGDKLQIQSMFVQSNDWFYSFGDGGLALFDGNTAVSGDVTSKLVLYDAGTEQDEVPGAGLNQKPVQDPLAMNVGPSDAVTTIKVAMERHEGFTHSRQCVGDPYNYYTAVSTNSKIAAYPDGSPAGLPYMSRPEIRDDSFLV